MTKRAFLIYAIGFRFWVQRGTWTRQEAEVKRGRERRWQGDPNHMSGGCFCSTR